MVRARQMLNKALPVGLGIVAGALLATGLAGRPALAGAAQVQDPAVQMQVQQALSNFQIQLQTQLNLMQAKIDALERNQQSTRYRLDTARDEALRPDAPIPVDPIPGITTFGRLVSRSSDSERFVVAGPSGGVRAQLGLMAEGPGLVLFDAGGRISAALLVTSEGPELRMADADGTLQTVVSGR